MHKIMIFKIASYDPFNQKYSKNVKNYYFKIAVFYVNIC